MIRTLIKSIISAHSASLFTYWNSSSSFWISLSWYSSFFWCTCREKPFKKCSTGSSQKHLPTSFWNSYAKSQLGPCMDSLFYMSINYWCVWQRASSILMTSSCLYTLWMRETPSTGSSTRNLYWVLYLLWLQAFCFCALPISCIRRTQSKTYLGVAYWWRSKIKRKYTVSKKREIIYKLEENRVTVNNRITKMGVEGIWSIWVMTLRIRSIKCNRKTRSNRSIRVNRWNISRQKTLGWKVEINQIRYSSMAVSPCRWFAGMGQKINM